jgi:NADH:ubiquinone oxidoreductase subunit D
MRAWRWCGKMAPLPIAMAIASGSACTMSSTNDDEVSREPATRTQCVALAEHMINVRIGTDKSLGMQRMRQQLREQLNAPAVPNGQAADASESTTGGFVEQCIGKYSVSQTRCAITSDSYQAFHSCLDHRAGAAAGAI